MPLIQSGSKKALKKNIATEMEAHPSKRKQDLAIAFSVQRKNKRKKMAEGGEAKQQGYNKDGVKTKGPAASSQPDSPDTGAGALYQGFADLGKAGKGALGSSNASAPSETASSMTGGAGFSTGGGQMSMRESKGGKIKKYAQGGQVLSDDQQPIKKENYKPKKLGDEYEGDNEPSLKAGATGKYMKPADKAYMGKDWAGGEMGDTPQDSDEHAPNKKDYSGQRYAKGGSVDSVENDAPEKDYYSREPGQPKAKSDDHRLDANYYENDDWTGTDGEPGTTEMHSFAGPSKEEYMANHMRMLAEGGHVACMHCGGMGYADGGEIHDDVDESHDIDADQDGGGSVAEQIMKKKIMTPTYHGDPYGSEDEWSAEGKRYAKGGKTELDDEEDPFDHGEGISDYQEEGPATRIKNNINSRDYNQGDDKQLSKQPMDSNEHGDDHEAELENKLDMIEQIRRKMKQARR